MSLRRSSGAGGGELTDMLKTCPPSSTGRQSVMGQRSFGNRKILHFLPFPQAPAYSFRKVKIGQLYTALLKQRSRTGRRYKLRGAQQWLGLQECGGWLEVQSLQRGLQKGQAGPVGQEQMLQGTGRKLQLCSEVLSSDSVKALRFWRKTLLESQ